MTMHSITKQRKLVDRREQDWMVELDTITDTQHRRYVYNIVWWDYLSKSASYIKPPQLVGAVCDHHQLADYLVRIGYTKRNAKQRARRVKNPADYPAYARKKAVVCDRLIA